MTERVTKPTAADWAQAAETWCLRTGWDAGELARRAGVSRTTVHHLRTGATRNPHLATLGRLAKAVGVSPCEFLAVSCGPSLAFNDPGRSDFDRRTNPCVREVAGERPELFDGWGREDWDELYSSFGVGGRLSPAGVETAAISINRRRETVHRLQVVLETHLADVAAGLVEKLYELVCPASPGMPNDEARMSKE
ncbi:MAG: helix-turn-helix domain-containing protein [Planctomycetes bacterium]|nr:helix-turn-helix domain-containing protein [Planctomycetota bacterium]